MSTDRVFDEAYYQRFYVDPRTRAMGPKAFTRLGNFVCSTLRYLEQPVRRVLDLGCGMGYWRNVIGSHYPRASYTGVEVSDYLCGKFGWQKGSVVDYRSRWPFDLVICSDVLQYLNEVDARAAITNLAELCRGVMYFGALTERDWYENCDQVRTDEVGYLRTGDWYRQHLAESFNNIGGGLFVSQRSSVVLYELETLGSRRETDG